MMTSPPAPWTSAECITFDGALQSLGLPAICLMEQAASAICDKVETLSKDGEKGIIGFLCGPGNNGADGIAAARKLLGHPMLEPHVLLLKPPTTTSSLLHTHFKVFESLGGKVHLGLDNWRAIAQLRPGLWVDALFGVGLDRPIEGELARFIAGHIPRNAPILAVDCPSGLDATTGNLLGTALPATWTLSFVAAKTGFFLNQGPSYCGEIQIADIGVRPEIANAWKANQGSFPDIL